MTTGEYDYINQYFSKRNQLSRFESELKDITNVLQAKGSIDEKHFENILNDWKRVSNSAFVNRIKATKEIRQVRGKTVSTIFQDPMTSLNPLLSVGFQISEVLRKQLKMSIKEAKKKLLNY
nr:hypothetical protein [Spiroplasma clarkii]